MLPDPYDPVPTFWERHSGWVAPLAVGALTVILLVAAFPPFHAPEAAYACLAPGAFWAYLRPRLKVYAWTMLAAQAVAWTINLSWLHYVTWAGLLILGPLVGAWTGTWYLAAWWALPRMAGRPTPIRLFAMLGLAGAWVLVEWTRTWLFGGFPWMPLAATQWESMRAVLQIAAYTGAAGVSFVIVAANIGIAAFSNRLFREGETGLRRRSPELLLALFLLLVCLSVHVQEATNQRQFAEPFARVAFVQPDIPALVKWDPSKETEIMRELWTTTLAAAPLNPDLVLWPESTTPFPLNEDLSMRRFVEQLSSRLKAPMLVGADAVERKEPGHLKAYNAAFVVDPQLGLQTAYYAKRRLVQFGEYIPLRPLLGWIGKFAPLGDDFSAGTDPSPLIVPLHQGSAAFGVLICYEDLFPELASQEVRYGAEALVVVTNDAWYGEGAAAYQHAAHSVLRAIETRRPVLRCGNAGWSGWIDEYGGIEKAVRNEDGSIYFRGTQAADVTRDRRWVGRNSFYVEHGDWFVAVSACLVLMGAALLGSHGLPPVAAAERKE
ncbi:MAG TPA: apolipoprotein N-acyltransferase [Opitutaceae bacterium]